MGKEKKEVAAIKEIMGRLSEAQREAAQVIGGKYGVTATAGAGKTSVMVARAAWMIVRGIDPGKILMFTFTRKAAEELKERVRGIGVIGSEEMTICTYHSLCVKILRRYGTVVGIGRDFTIMSTSDRNETIRRIIEERELWDEIEVRVSGSPTKVSRAAEKEKKIALVSRIISAKMESGMSGRPDEGRSDEGRDEYDEIYREYMRKEIENQCIDYDGMMYWAIKVMEGDEGVRREIQETYQYIMADEFQDSSPQNLRLLRLLAGDDSERWNVWAVFDCDQSIYGFRGVNLRSIQDFLRGYGFRVMNLGENYRSTKSIVESSSGIIRNNENEFRGEIYTANDIGSRVRIFEEVTDVREAEKIANIVYAAITDEGIARRYGYEDIAILYRTHKQSIKIEKALRKKGIPVRVVGRKGEMREVEEIQNIIGYCRLVVNMNDEAAFLRVCNVPPRGIGEVTKDTIMRYKKEYGCDLLEACVKVSLRDRRQREGIKNFLNDVTHVRRVYNAVQADSKKSMRFVIEEIIKNLGYDDDRVWQDRKDILDTLRGIAEEHRNIIRFTDALDEKEDECNVSGADGEERVTMMTVHASKGLEWPVVIVAGCSQGVFPSSMAIKFGEIEEERRLFFVACTRAKEELILTWGRENMTSWGRSRIGRKSQFLSEIPIEYIEERRK